MSELIKCIKFALIKKNPAMHDIQNDADIQLLVDNFYAAIRQDELVGPVFNERLESRWQGHLGKMYLFWQTLLLGRHNYIGSPFPPHASMPIAAEHFNRWREIFYNTVDTYFTGEKADEAKWRADKMATIFLSKIEYYKNATAMPLV